MKAKKGAGPVRKSSHTRTFSIDGRSYSLKITSLGKPGAPRKIARDVSLTLHSRFLKDFARLSSAAAHERVADIFNLADTRGIPRIISRTQRQFLAGYMNTFVGAVLDANGHPQGRLMISLPDLEIPKTLSRIEGEGFVVRWGQQEAVHGVIICEFITGEEPRSALLMR